MQTIVIPIIVAVVASSGFWAFLQAWIGAKGKKKSVDRKALLALLHDKLYTACREVIKKGEIAADEYENLHYLYEPYLGMGGNGTCERLMNEVDKLPIIK